MMIESAMTVALPGFFSSASCLTTSVSGTHALCDASPSVSETCATAQTSVDKKSEKQWTATSGAQKQMEDSQVNKLSLSGFLTSRQQMVNALWPLLLETRARAMLFSSHMRTLDLASADTQPERREDDIEPYSKIIHLIGHRVSRRDRTPIDLRVLLSDHATPMSEWEQERIHDVYRYVALARPTAPTDQTHQEITEDMMERETETAGYGRRATTTQVIKDLHAAIKIMFDAWKKNAETGVLLLIDLTLSTGFGDYYEYPQMRIRRKISKSPPHRRSVQGHIALAIGLSAS
ncbi:hypothetical protein CORC01_00051 [Colletotrichum orchidophilum]|uniref:Uncharacterized protein n=1 Tax=Colletotrichum orchidophilum TaxID=1209926 RepID=A0A1G4BT48_9PEZI|nr:uncharacterized protein CORC01_00051 [Colletotrichum orchidophilum]OHF04580.1 hypothetical protein CORC01_00051 [Colletotrichum orchidophilum]